jgi:hypothetical protein
MLLVASKGWRRFHGSCSLPKLHLNCVCSSCLPLPKGIYNQARSSANRARGFERCSDRVQVLVPLAAFLTIPRRHSGRHRAALGFPR